MTPAFPITKRALNRARDRGVALEDVQIIMAEGYPALHKGGTEFHWASRITGPVRVVVVEGKVVSVYRRSPRWWPVATEDLTAPPPEPETLDVIGRPVGPRPTLDAALLLSVAVALAASAAAMLTWIGG